MSWTLERTTTFLKALKVHRKNAELLRALDNRMTRLRNDPASVGGKLTGALHGWQSTRLIRKFRLLFRLDAERQTVILGAIDHRDDAYD